MSLIDDIKQRHSAAAYAFRCAKGEGAFGATEQEMLAEFQAHAHADLGFLLSEYTILEELRREFQVLSEQRMAQTVPCPCGPVEEVAPVCTGCGGPRYVELGPEVVRLKGEVFDLQVAVADLQEKTLTEDEIDNIRDLVERGALTENAHRLTIALATDALARVDPRTPRSP